MMKAVAIVGLALLATGGTASAGVPAVYKAPKPSDAMPTATNAATAPQSSASQLPPKGIPGYFDPATQTFTPLQAPQSGTPTIDGELALRIYLLFYGSEATVNVILNSNYGSYRSSSQATPASATTSSFVVGQYNSTYASFPVSSQSSTKTVTRSFATDYPVVQTRVDCAASTSTVSYATSVLVAQQAPKSGTTQLNVKCTL